MSKVLVNNLAPDVDSFIKENRNILNIEIFMQFTDNNFEYKKGNHNRRGEIF